MSATDATPTADSVAWFLEAVRGARPGETYPLDAGEVDLGNGPPGTPGLISLADQEGASPRRMESRHAALFPEGGGGWSIRDRESPGGTFVNNRRVLPGVLQPLASGDLVQLGSVQLRVVRVGHAGGPSSRRSAYPAPPPTTAAPASFLFRSSLGGSTCRTWDDFLTLAAQHWDELRADLDAGHLAEFARSVGRPDLAPPPGRPGESADGRLDAWLGRLPTRSPAAPELDVHPTRVVVAVPGGGATVRRRIRVSNVGHRLLRATVAVAPGSEPLLRLPPEVDRRELVVQDSLDVPFEVAAPDPLDAPVAGELVVAGAGATCRVAVVVERRAGVEAGSVDDLGPPGSAEAAPAAVGGWLRAWRGLTLAQRVALGALVGPLARLQVGVLGGGLGDSGLVASGPEIPSLGLEAAALAALGAIVGWLAGRRPGARGDSAWSAVGGAGLGVGAALLLVATCRGVEPILGPLSTSIPAVLGLWAVLGVGLAVVAGRPAAATPAEGDVAPMEVER